MASQAETPLQGWKAIGRHIGRSERTAQRWKRKSLPVYNSEVLGVIAYPSEIDVWMRAIRLDSTGYGASEHPNDQDSGPPEPDCPSPITPNSGNSIRETPDTAFLHPEIAAKISLIEAPRPGPLVTRVSSGARLGIGIGLFSSLIAAVAAPAYALAIVIFALGAVFVGVNYHRLKDTPAARASVAVYIVAAMAYICSASTMPEFQASVVNAATLPVSATFLIIIGLKFISLFFLVLSYWVVLERAPENGRRSNSPKQKWYAFLGLQFLVVELLLLAVSSGDDLIWSAGVPGRWTLLVSSTVVLAANLVVWLAGNHYFFNESNASPRFLFGFCATMYLIIAVAAYFIDHEHNQFNRYYLDVRWPEAYVVRSPEAINDLAALPGTTVRTEIGRDLASLLKDEEFRMNLRQGTFYKQHSDESFRIFHPTVMFAYKRPVPSNSGQAPFVSIRFPKELADALRFELVSEKN